jgi:hypothetical protein
MCFVRCLENSFVAEYAGHIVFTSLYGGGPNGSRALASKRLMTGPGEAGEELLEGVLAPSFPAPSQLSSSTQHAPWVCLPSITPPSRQFPGLLCFGTGFFSFLVLFLVASDVLLRLLLLSSVRDRSLNLAVWRNVI